jgi:ribosomal protein S27AE
MSNMAELFDVFFNGRKANVNGVPGLGDINRKCPKCGVVMANMAWEPTFKQIRLTCVGGCGYAWWAKPLDASTSNTEVKP